MKPLSIILHTLPIRCTLYNSSCNPVCFPQLALMVIHILHALPDCCAVFTTWYYHSSMSRLSTLPLCFHCAAILSHARSQCRCTQSIHAAGVDFRHLVTCPSTHPAFYPTYGTPYLTFGKIIPVPLTVPPYVFLDPHPYLA